MNFLAMPTLKNVRSCFRRPISMMPRFSLKLTLARLRTGIESAGSLLFCAALIITSATPTSFFSTTPLFFGFFCAMFFPYLSGALGTRFGRFKTQTHLLRARRWNFRRVLLFRHLRFVRFGRFRRFRFFLGSQGRRRCVYAEREILQRHTVDRLISVQNRSISLGAFGGDNDRVRETFRTAAVVPQ